MTLKTVHQILIASGVLLGVLMMAFAVIRYAGGDVSVVPTGVLGAVGAVVLSLYLRWFRKKSAP